MADINATSLTTKTTPDGTDNLVLFNQNTNVGYQIDYDNLASAILDKLTSKTYTNQVGGSSAATLLAQLATLNSNIGNLAFMETLTAEGATSITTTRAYTGDRLYIAVATFPYSATARDLGFMLFNLNSTTVINTFAVGYDSFTAAVNSNGSVTFSYGRQYAKIAIYRVL